MSVNVKVTGGLNIEWGQIDPKVTGGLKPVQFKKNSQNHNLATNHNMPNIKHIISTQSFIYASNNQTISRVLQPNGRVNVNEHDVKVNGRPVSRTMMKHSSCLSNIRKMK